MMQQNVLCLLLDENGLIAYKWVSDDPLVEPNYQEIKDFLNKGN